MRIVVVYESMFGNCAHIAQAIAEGLREGSSSGASSKETAPQITVIDVADAITAPDLLNDVSLLVAGGPTHDLGLSKPRTRATAFDIGQGAIQPRAVGLREWSAALSVPAGGLKVAAFETRASKVPLPSSAAKSLTKAMRKAGFSVLAPFAVFHVGGAQGPLPPEELIRALEWGRQLAHQHAADAEAPGADQAPGSIQAPGSVDAASDQATSDQAATDPVKASHGSPSPEKPHQQLADHPLPPAVTAADRAAEPRR